MYKGNFYVLGTSKFCFIFWGGVIKMLKIVCSIVLTYFTTSLSLTTMFYNSLETHVDAHKPRWFAKSAFSRIFLFRPMAGFATGVRCNFLSWETPLI